MSVGVQYSPCPYDLLTVYGQFALPLSSLIKADLARGWTGTAGVDLSKILRVHTKIWVGQRVVITDKNIGVSKLLEATYPDWPPQFYAYAWDRYIKANLWKGYQDLHPDLHWRRLVKNNEGEDQIFGWGKNLVKLINAWAFLNYR